MKLDLSKLSQQELKSILSQLDAIESGNYVVSNGVGYANGFEPKEGK